MKLAIKKALAAACGAGLMLSAAAISTPVGAADDLSAPVPRAEGWLVKSYGQIESPAPPKNAQSELAALKSMTAKRTAQDIARFRWWATGGPVHRWNEIVLDELQESFVTLPLAARHLALFHAALDDAVAAARHHRKSTARAEPAGIDAAINAAGRSPAVTLSPSDHAAAAAAAAEVLGYLFPARAAHYSAQAEDAMRTRLLAGAEYPHEVAAGRVIGQRVAALAIARGKSDGSDAKWSGSVPEGPGR
jgi:membrane-associated phospholipid phosphatase